ncbi:MAG: tetratricopeptide repeat protein [Acidobacteriaceae bacterium]
MDLTGFSPGPFHLSAYRDAWMLRAATLLLAALLLTPALAAQDFSHPDSEPAPQAALIQQANDALAASDFPAAFKILTGLNSQLPNNPQVLYDLGLTLEALGPETPTPTAPDSKIPTAESYYRQSISANPFFAAPHVALGLLLARTARPAEAHSELLTATTLADVAPALRARAFRALAKLDQQSTPPNPAAASSELLAALNLTTEAPEDILLAAEIAESAADLPSAESAYRRYLALPEEAGDPQVIAALAHVLLGEHRTADAEALLTPALAAHPADPSLTALLARAYISSDDPAKVAQAVPLLEKLHTANPQDANITRLLARVFLDTDRPDQADPLYAALIAAQGMHPDPTLLDDRAEALLRLHRPGAAETLLKQATANPAAFPTPAALGDAATHLAFAAAEIDDPATTLQALALRATVLPPSPQSLFLQATANDSLHQISKAIDLYKQFLAAAGGNFPEQESQARQRLAALTPRK